MQVKVKLFASLREEHGFQEKTLELEDLSTAADVWAIAVAAEPPSNLLCAINHDYADIGESVSDGDEVGFFPPVNGG